MVATALRICQIRKKLDSSRSRAGGYRAVDFPAVSGRDEYGPDRFSPERIRHTDVKRLSLVS